MVLALMAIPEKCKTHRKPCWDQQLANKRTCSTLHFIFCWVVTHPWGSHSTFRDQLQRTFMLESHWSIPARYSSPAAIHPKDPRELLILLHPCHRIPIRIPIGPMLLNYKVPIRILVWHVQILMWNKVILYYKGLFFVNHFLCDVHLLMSTFLCMEFPKLASFLYIRVYCSTHFTYDGPFGIHIVSYVLLWVHLMYSNYCGVWPLYIDVPYIYSVLPSIMSPSYLLQCLTLGVSYIL